MGNANQGRCMSTVHVIGAGLSGLSAAVELAESGAHVCVYEASAAAGGRCKSYEDSALGITINQSSPLLIGAQKHLGALIKKARAEKNFQPLQGKAHFCDIRYGISWQLHGKRYLPALPLVEYLRLLRCLFTFSRKPVAAQNYTRSRLFRRFIAPSCVSLLNTLPTDVPAKLLARAMWQSLLCASTPRTAKGGWSRALITPILQHLQEKDGHVYFNQDLKTISTQGARVTHMTFGRKRVEVRPQDMILLALPAHVLAKLLPETTWPTEYESTISAVFACPHQQQVGTWVGVVGGIVDKIFYEDGHIIALTHAANTRTRLTGEKLAREIWAEICMATDMPKDIIPSHKLLSERRATLKATSANLAACNGFATKYENLFLAGEVVDVGRAPGIESAVLSGKRAAQQILALRSQKR